MHAICIPVGERAAKHVMFSPIRSSRNMTSWSLMFCAVAFNAVMFEATLARLELTDRNSEECSEEVGKGSHDSHVTVMHPLYTGVHSVQSAYVRTYIAQGTHHKCSMHPYRLPGC